MRMLRICPEDSGIELEGEQREMMDQPAFVTWNTRAPFVWGRPCSRDSGDILFPLYLMESTGRDDALTFAVTGD